MEKKKFKVTYIARDAESYEIRCICQGRPMIFNAQILYDDTIDFPFEIPTDISSKQKTI